MFEADFSGELNFVLEFNLPKEISDNQDLIKLQVHRMEVPAVEPPGRPFGLKFIPAKMSGEIRCIEHYKYIKDVLPLINRWVDSIYCACSKLNGCRSDKFVEAKLYAYKKDYSLFRKWNLVEFYPLFNPDNGYTGNVELIFKFEDVIEEDNKSAMYDINKYIQEYKDRNNKCEFCAYHNIHGGRCHVCKNHDWFVHDINLKQYIIKRVTEDSEKEFISSKEGANLKAKVELRKSVYDDFNKYVENQKEFLDNELELKRKEWSDLSLDYSRKIEKYTSDNMYKALASLESME